MSKYSTLNPSTIMSRKSNVVNTDLKKAKLLSALQDIDEG